MKHSQILNFCAPEWDRRRILRYAGAIESDRNLNALLEECIDEIKEDLIYRVCYRILPLKKEKSLCDFSFFSAESEGLSNHLKGVESVALFAATIGFAPDRLMGKYSLLSPAKALMFQAIGAERVEALCDLFCNKIEEKFKVFPRFSPGYADLALSVQRDIFDVLDCRKWLGITLNDSFLISPTKSVTAFLGIAPKETD